MPERSAKLLIMFAALLYEKARFTEAEPILRRALAIVEASYGPDHPHCGGPPHNLAVLLMTTNRLARGRDAHVAATLAIQEKSDGPDHPEVATASTISRNCSALPTASARPSRSFAGRWRSRKKAMGRITPAWRRLNNLALLLQAQTASPRRSRSFRRALTIRGRATGPTTQRGGEPQHLARLLEATNRLGEAEPLFRRALEIDEASFGPDHPEVAIRPQQFRGPPRDTNRLDEAEPLIAARSRSTKRASGRTIPTWRPTSTISRACPVTTNRLREAEPLLRRALAIDEASFGPNDPKWRPDLNNLARCSNPRTVPRRPSRSCAARSDLRKKHRIRIIQRGALPQQSRQPASSHQPPHRGRAAHAPRAGDIRRARADHPHVAVCPGRSRAVPPISDTTCVCAISVPEWRRADSKRIRSGRLGRR